MTRAEMLDLIRSIAKAYDPAELEYLYFLYDVDLTRPDDYTDDKLAEVLNAWSEFGKGFDK